MVLYNDKALDITKGIVENLADKNLYELILRLIMASGGEKKADEFRDEIAKQIQNVIVRKQSATFLITLGTHPIKYYQVILTAIEELGDDASRRSIGMACLLSDISIYEQIDDFKQILQTISERGRNHLTPIIGYLQLLERSDDLSYDQ